jgi:hypothetical protein
VRRAILAKAQKASYREEDFLGLGIDYPVWITPVTEAKIPDRVCSAEGL